MVSWHECALELLRAQNHVEMGNDMEQELVEGDV